MKEVKMEPDGQAVAVDYAAAGQRSRGIKGRFDP